MNLNNQQKAAAESTAKKTLVIAGPGSGKTATLTARIVHLLRTGNLGRKIVAITFTNAAADEIQKRVEAEVGGAVKLGFIGTIHSYAMKLLREHGAGISLPDKLSVMDEAQSDDTLQATAKRLHYKGTKKALEASVKERLACLKGGSFNVLDATRPNLDAPGLVAYEFIRGMAAAGVFSFDAIVSFAHAVLDKSFDDIGKTVDEVLVDEYQDCSNEVDWLCAALPGRKFFVGDPDQAIYGFAGGNVSHIVGYANDKDWACYILEDNYRSTRNICDAAQSLIQRNMNRVSKATRPVNGKSLWPVMVSNFFLPSEEAGFLVGELRRAAADKKTCAVLARSNYIANATALALQQAGIVIRKKERIANPGDFGLARRFIALAANPENDDMAFGFLLATRGDKFAAKARLEAAEAGRTINAHLLKMPVELDVKQVPEILERIAVSTETVAIVKKAMEGLRDGDGVAELGIALGNPELHYREVGDGSAVVVTTIHSAKGREWDWVFVVAAEDGVIPGRAEGQTLYEERRLMFVALTRARERAVLTHATQRTKGDWQKRPEPAIPSRFLAELGV